MAKAFVFKCLGMEKGVTLREPEIYHTSKYNAFRLVILMAAQSCRSRNKELQYQLCRKLNCTPTVLYDRLKEISALHHGGRWKCAPTIWSIMAEEIPVEEKEK